MTARTARTTGATRTAGIARTWSEDGTYLAFDTSTSLGSVCLGVGARVVAGRPLRGQSSHSSDLIPAIDAVLREAGVQASELSGLVVGAGPGSFTGVRVAAATAKGLAYALGLPLWAVSSIEAGAAAMDVDGIGFGRGDEEERARPRYVLFDARSDRVYGACYRPTSSGFEVLVPPHSTTIGEVLAETLPSVVFSGDGAQRHEDEIRGVGFRLLPAPLGMPTAAGLLKAVEYSQSRAPVEDVSRWQPEYLRTSSVERLSGSRAGRAG
jgi:tRNA threonylcarbamoyl adenosine modification protein YeaZ